jgi:LysR family transcriptional regulator, glycine cleavage system transcriptional activator
MAINDLPLTAVRAFCAAAEHLSFKDAALSMHITPGAISQQVKQLEEWFGQKLFERRVRGVTLTEAGRQFFTASQKALRQLNQAALALRPEEKVVRITTVPSVAARWMVPRLAAFSKLHPQIEVSIDASVDLADLEHGAFDLAIRCVNEPPRDHHGVKLFDEVWWPVCSPTYKKAHIKAGAIKPEARLLHEINITQSKERWLAWLHEYDRRSLLSRVENKGAYFSHEMLAYQAAIQSQGIALANRPLIEKELAEGSLVVALNKPLNLGRSYYLMWSKSGERQNNPKGSIQLFRQWLTT